MNDQKEQFYFPTWWSAWYYLLFFFVRPAYKHLEYSYGFPRVNIAFIGMASLVILLLYFITTKNKISRLIPGLAFPVLFLLFVILIQILQAPFVIPYGGSTIYLKTIAYTVFGYTGFFLCGVYFLNIFKNISIKRIIVIAWIALTTFELAYSLINPKGFYLFMGDTIGYYLMMADSYVFLTLVVLSFCTRFHYKIIIYCVSILTLLALLSRTSLYLFIFIAGIMMFWQHKKIVIIFISIFLCFVFYTNYHFHTQTLVQQGIHYRMIRLFTEKEDSSWQKRKDLFSQGMNNIQEQWLFGDFMGDVRDNHGETGHYIHNIFSYWQQFGLVPFALLIILLTKNIYLFLDQLHRKKSCPSDEEWFLVTVTAYGVLIMVISRSHMVPYTWLLLSILPVAIFRQKKKASEQAAKEIECHQEVFQKYRYLFR